VATFTDNNTADTAAGFTASITWGDGTTSAGTVSGSNGSFSVTGGHTYADEGSFPLSVAITRTADKATTTPTGTVTAAEADALTPHAVSISGTAGQALNNVTVATFTDSDKANTASDFTASIAWGDGTSSAGKVSGSNGTFTVTGSHTYAAAGTDAVAVTLTDDAPGSAKATANSTAQIAPAGNAGTTSGRTAAVHFSNAGRCRRRRIGRKFAGTRRRRGIDQRTVGRLRNGQPERVVVVHQLRHPGGGRRRHLDPERRGSGKPRQQRRDRCPGLARRVLGG
jgi:hypothetical protein